jgi:IS605 OrfB family transposase
VAPDGRRFYLPKARLRLARLEERMANQRCKFPHQLSRQLVEDNGFIGLEDLNVRGRMANRRLAKSMGDAGWSQFVEILKYKAAWYGCRVKKVSRGYLLSLHQDLSVLRPGCGSVAYGGSPVAKPLLRKCTRQRGHCCSQPQDSSIASMRRDYRGSRGMLRLGTVGKTLSRWPCWANQEANLLVRLVVHPIALLDFTLMGLPGEKAASSQKLP